MANYKGRGHASRTSFGNSEPNIGKAGPGADPETMKARMRIMADRKETVAALQRILDNPKHPQFVRALEMALQRGYGNVPNDARLTGNILVRVVRDADPRDEQEEAYG